MSNWLKTLTVACVVVVLGLSAQAVPILHGDLVDVRFKMSPGLDFANLGLTVDASDANPALGVGDPPVQDVEVAHGDGSPIAVSGVLFDKDWIDIDDDVVTFQIQGGGPTHSPGYQTKGAGPDARFEITGMDFTPATPITSVGIVLIDIIGVAEGTELTFTGDSLTLIFGTLGIRADTDVGQVIVTLNPTDPGPDVIPEPTTLALLGLGVVGGLVRRRRRR